MLFMKVVYLHFFNGLIIHYGCQNIILLKDVYKRQGQNAIFSKYPIKSVSNISKNELINFYCIDYNSLPISIVNCHLESNNIGQLLQASKTKLVFLSSQKYITQSYNKLK